MRILEIVIIVGALVFAILVILGSFRKGSKCSSCAGCTATCNKRKPS